MLDLVIVLLLLYAGVVDEGTVCLHYLLNVWKVRYFQRYGNSVTFFILVWVDVNMTSCYNAAIGVLVTVGGIDIYSDNIIVKLLKSEVDAETLCASFVTVNVKNIDNVIIVYNVFIYLYFTK